ncbi:receptor like protein kinase S.2 [Raphanus sativus]|uniref:Receptor like protein kinase S.2 n=1 Tax=Raphanus sativus TaxID=3726 RepID=A0A6J0MX65_RAPSA|nr:receptor like protein kinase S.2 [Raphanus sativus]
MAPMSVDRLCFVLPAESGELKPSIKTPAMVEETKEEEKKTRDCGRQVVSLVGDLFRRLHSSKLVKSLNLCISERHKDSNFPEINDKPFTDMEGVQLSDKIGAENPRIFGYSELYIGSNGFSDELILGSGGFGRVYKAVLPSDGTTVAVKCLAEKKGEQFEKTFAAELVAVAQLRHRNLVKLRGWCLNDDELLLVYDYMPNRSLDRVLFRRPEMNSKFKPLDWDRRGKIVKGLAAALFYLHEQLETQIIHRDVKTSNVMLDSEFNARLGDFGLARWLEHEVEEPDLDPSYDSVSSFRNHQFRVADSTRIGGTIGYLPPESFRRKKTVATAKTDVFSFGVVLLEVVSGRRAVDLSFPEDRIVLLDWVRRLSDDRKILAAGDSRLPRGSYAVSDMKRMIHLALLCSLNSPHLRPNMKWVIGALSGEFSGDLPALPSFKSHPLYIPLSSLKSTSTSATTTTTTATTTNPTTSTTSLNASSESTPSSDYVTALEDSIYQTAETGENRYFTNNSRRMMSSKSFVLDTPREISYNDIVLATDNFSDARRVAEVDFGTAYYGLLNRDQKIVVKRLGMTKCPALVTRFSTELLNLGRLRHRNLVMLRGWCTEHGEMLVVYDYSANRKLSHLLFHSEMPGNMVLRWKTRYNVIKSLACAIRYLHEEWDEQVVHRNITSSTIFLDRDMNPRLCGFALAEFLSRNDQAHQAAKKKGSAQGIFGYMAPEYMESGEATTAADVYSFGMVILEMVTGQPAVDYTRKKEDALLVLRIRDLVGNKKKPLEEIADVHLDDEYERREMARVLRLGLVCTRTDPKLRPSISQVVCTLDGSERFFKEEGGKEGDVSRKEMYDSSMLMVRQMQALGIH